MTKVEGSGSDAPTNRSQQRKEKHRRGQKKEKIKPLTKVIVRHLPPTMSEEEFLKQIELPDHDFFYYATADWSLGNCATCRAYVTLKRYDDVFLFRDRFDGYVFVDSKGAEYSAIVEFAPFQGLLKNRSRRSDNKANTIEQEPHYQQFLAKLQEEREAVAKGSDIKLEFSLDRKKEEITSTPLLQYLANKKEKRREEAKKRSEEKRRQREEEKERRRQAQQQQQQPQITKIMTGQSNPKASGVSTGGNGKNKDGNIAGGERKNSRAKRKAEREQRRKEQREKALPVVEDKPDKSEHRENVNATDEKDIKESKKYSDKRERDRERNRNRKDKDKQKSDTPSASTEGTAKSTTSNEASTVITKQKSKDEQISDTVLNFIRSCVNVKEFVPKHKQQSEEAGKSTDAGAEIEDKKSRALESKEQSKSIVQKENPKEMQVNKDQSVKRSETASVRQREEIGRQKREDRRIRNKDRPSIAIYQPKIRQRTSEESDSNAGHSIKDTRSNPTSDCESVKKDDLKSGKKKVSRYSERRSERRASHKTKSNEAVEDSSEILRKSSSTEEQCKPDSSLEKESKDDVIVKKKIETLEKQEA